MRLSEDLFYSFFVGGPKKQENRTGLQISLGFSLKAKSQRAFSLRMNMVRFKTQDQLLLGAAVRLFFECF